MQLATKIGRWVSSGFIALAASGIVFLFFGVIYEHYHLQSKLGVDDDVCLLALFTGPLFMALCHRQYHSIHWLSWVCVVLGFIGLVAAVITFFWMTATAKTHVPTGPFSGFGYVIMQLLSLYIGGVALAVVLGGMLGIVARRMDKVAEQSAALNVDSVALHPHQ